MVLIGIFLMASETEHLFMWEKERAAHSRVLAWRIPGTGEPAGLPYGVAQSRTRLKRLSSSSSSVYMLIPIPQFIPPVSYNAVALFVLFNKNHLVLIEGFESYSPLDMNALI